MENFNEIFNDAIPEYPLETSECVLDLNNIMSRKNELIPDNTYVKVQLNIRPGSFGDDRMLTKAKNSGLQYLNTILVVCDGPYVSRRIYHRFTVQNTDNTGYDSWVERGQKQLRSVIEAAYNIQPDDMSEEAMKKRRLRSFKDLDGLQFFIRVGVKEDRNPAFGPSNYMRYVVTPDFVEYNACQEGSDHITTWP